MKTTYDKIFDDVNKLIKKYNTRDPEEIIKEKGIHIIPFRQNTTVLGIYKVIHRNKFIFYNPYVDKRILRMVFAHELGHDMYHKDEASKEDLIEYELFDINSSMEVEANIFAAHLLLDENELINYIKCGYTYDALAKAFNVNVNLVVLKLNEMSRMGFPIRKEDRLDNTFFTKIDGRDKKHFEPYE